MNKQVAKDLCKIIGFFIYIICLIVSIYISIYKTPQSFNIIPLIAIAGAAVCSWDEGVKICNLIDSYINKKKSKEDTKNL